MTNSSAPVGVEQVDREAAAWEPTEAELLAMTLEAHIAFKVYDADDDCIRDAAAMLRRQSDRLRATPASPDRQGGDAERAAADNALSMRAAVDLATRQQAEARATSGLRRSSAWGGRHAPRATTQGATDVE